jgi:hypothetical protein
MAENLTIAGRLRDRSVSEETQLEPEPPAGLRESRRIVDGDIGRVVDREAGLEIRESPA